MSAPRILVAATLALLLAARPAGAVVGPTISDPGLGAHVIMVLMRKGAAAGFCSGVVVARNAVLTAAHCVTRPARMRLFYRDAGHPVMLDVARIAVNPGYHADAQIKRIRTVDLALVESAVPLPARFQPAQFSARDEARLHETFLIAGYGMGREHDPASTGVLRVARIETRAPLSHILLWAQDPGHDGAGACEGDSGAPIFAAATHRVLAITAWADGHGRHVCGAFTQGTFTAPQRGWIKRVLQSWR
ncbi:MAG: trypsin-like serine protease [Hyphomicrobiales bacterium]|nr:trypsin-like serine protease [Hyphomicrobiales bacterium]